MQKASFLSPSTTVRRRTDLAKGASFNTQSVFLQQLDRWSTAKTLITTETNPQGSAGTQLKTKNTQRTHLCRHSSTLPIVEYTNERSNVTRRSRRRWMVLRWAAHGQAATTSTTRYGNCKGVAVAAAAAAATRRLGSPGVVGPSRGRASSPVKRQRRIFEGRF